MIPPKRLLLGPVLRAPEESSGEKLFGGSLSVMRDSGIALHEKIIPTKIRGNNFWKSFWTFWKPFGLLKNRFAPTQAWGKKGHD